MGQYGNQPDFGTIASEGIIAGIASDPTTAFSLKSAALYIGTGGTLICRVIGGNAGYNSPDPVASGLTVFKNIPDGTFFPVIVDCIWEDDGDGNLTTCSDIIALY